MEVVGYIALSICLLIVLLAHIYDDVQHIGLIGWQRDPDYDQLQFGLDKDTDKVILALSIIKSYTIAKEKGISREEVDSKVRQLLADQGSKVIEGKFSNRRKK